MFRFLLLSFDIGFCVIYLMEIQQEQQEEKEEVCWFSHTIRPIHQKNKQNISHLICV
jgi:hypothetical protein